jgi:hypothetical protein
MSVTNRSNPGVLRSDPGNFPSGKPTDHADPKPGIGSEGRIIPPDGGSDYASVAIESLVTSSGAGSNRRGWPKGKPRGTRTPNDEAAAHVHSGLGDVTDILLTFHAMLALLTTIKEFELDKTEAQKLNVKIQALSEHYDNLKIVSPKTRATIELILTAGGIYGSRVMAYSMRRAEEKKRKPLSVMPKQAHETRGAVNGFPAPDLKQPQPAQAQAAGGGIAPGAWSEPAMEDSD